MIVKAERLLHPVPVAQLLSPPFLATLFNLRMHYRPIAQSCLFVNSLYPNDSVGASVLGQGHLLVLLLVVEVADLATLRIADETVVFESPSFGSEHNSTASGSSFKNLICMKNYPFNASTSQRSSTACPKCPLASTILLKQIARKKGHSASTILPKQLECPECHSASTIWLEYK